MQPTVHSHEYAFDVKLFAVVRVTAPSEPEARKAVASALDAANIGVTLHSPSGAVKITEASVYVDDECGPHLIEIDGEDCD